MRLLKYPETLDLEVTRNHKDSVLLVRKWDSQGSWECWLKNIWFPLRTCSSLWRYYETCVITSTTWGNCLCDNHCSKFWQQGSWKPRNKGILLSLKAFWRAENSIPLVSWDPRLKVMWLLVGHIGHFDTLKMQFCWVMRPWAQGNMASNLNTYRIIKAWKFYYSSATRPSNNMYLAFHKASVRYFGGLKMKFFTDQTTLGYTIVERWLHDCQTNVRSIIDCLRIVDCWTIVEAF